MAGVPSDRASRARCETPGTRKNVERDETEGKREREQAGEQASLEGPRERYSEVSSSNGGKKFAFERARRVIVRFLGNGFDTLIAIYPYRDRSGKAEAQKRAWYI